MGVFRYDLYELTSVSDGLAALKGDYENASRSRGEVDGALGYGDLRGAVQDFVGNWKHERDKQLEAIEGASQALRTIIDGYVAYDDGAAEQLRSDCAP